MKTLAVVKTRANFALCLTSTHYTRTHTTVHRYVYTTQEREEEVVTPDYRRLARSLGWGKLRGVDTFLVGTFGKSPPLASQLAPASSPGKKRGLLLVSVPRRECGEQWLKGERGDRGGAPKEEVGPPKKVPK